MKLKIVSYNIKSMRYDPENPRNNIDRREDVAEVLRRLDGDIVGLQEVDHFLARTGDYDQTKYLAETLGYPYYHFTYTVDKGKGTEGKYGHAIMSKYPIKELEDKEFSVQISERRKYCRAVIDVEGKELVFYNAHLTTSGHTRIGLEPNKIFAQYQLKELMNRIYAEESPVVLTGDFNLIFEKQKECVDTEKVYPLNGGKDFSVEEPKTRIDNIYLCNIEKHDAAVTYGERGASDHPWIHADIEI